MSVESERDRLGVLLNHWVEHNVGHAREFRDWAEKARVSGQGLVSEDIVQAAHQMDKANEYLLAALGKLKEG